MLGTDLVARSGCGEGARGVESPNTDEACCAALLAPELGFPAAATGGGEVYRGVPKADDCNCSAVLFGMGAGGGFGGFGGAS